jgi:hypothetical protein
LELSKDAITLEKQLLEEQKSNFEKERKRVTDAALKLNEERIKLEVRLLSHS